MVAHGLEPFASGGPRPSAARGPGGPCWERGWGRLPGLSPALGYRVTRTKASRIPCAQAPGKWPGGGALLLLAGHGSPWSCPHGLDPVGRRKISLRCSQHMELPHRPGKTSALGSVVYKGGSSRAVKADQNSATSALCCQRSSLQPTCANRSQGSQQQSQCLEVSLRAQLPRPAGSRSAPWGAACYFPSFGNSFPLLSSNTGSFCLASLARGHGPCTLSVCLLFGC